jgi:hypothetical protein
LEFRDKQGPPLFPLLVNIVLEILDKATRLEKDIKGIQIGKEEVKLSLLSHDIILYLTDPKNSTQKNPLRHNKHFHQSSRVQNQCIKISGFLYTNNEQAEKEIPFTIASKDSTQEQILLRKGSLYNES